MERKKVVKKTTIEMYSRLGTHNDDDLLGRALSPVCLCRWTVFRSREFIFLQAEVGGLRSPDFGRHLSRLSFSSPILLLRINRV